MLESFVAFESVTLQNNICDLLAAEVAQMPESHTKIK